MKNYIFKENFNADDRLFFPAYVLKIKRHVKFSLVSLRRASKTYTAALRPAQCAKDAALLREGMYADFHCTAVREFHAENGLELNITDFEILSPAAEPPKSAASEMSASEEIREKIRLLPRGASDYIYLISNDIQYAFRGFMLENGFFEVATPIVVSKSEKDGFAFDYFGQTAELAFSPQLALTPCTAAFERVFEISHSFTSKRRGSTRHLNEFTSLNFQAGYIECLDDIIKITESAVFYIMNYVKEKRESLLNGHEITLRPIDNIPTITLKRAFEILKSEPRRDLNPTEAKKISEYMKPESDFLFLRDFPTKDGKFYVCQRDGATQRFELYYKGIKIADGSENIFDFAEIDEPEAKRYPVYYDTVRHGIMPYGGVMIGLERFVMQLLNLSDIRRSAIFPRDVRNLIP